MAGPLNSQAGIARLTSTVLRTAGGRSVLLRLPAPAIAGIDAEQLGLATPQFQDVVMEPVAFRKAVSENRLLVSSHTIETLIGTLGYDAADALFETAAGIVVDGVLFTITNCIAYEAIGGPYCFCLTLRAPVR